MNEINKTTYMLKKRNDQTRRIEHLATLSSPPNLEEVRKQFGEGKYLVFVVQQGKKGIRKYLGFSVDKNGKIAEGTTPLVKQKDDTQGVDIPRKSLELAEKGAKKTVDIAKKTPYYVGGVTPAVKYQKVLIGSEILKKNGKLVRRDYFKNIIPAVGTTKGTTGVEDKKTDDELKECIVSKDSFIDDAMVFISTLIVSGAAYLGLSIWKNQTQK